MSLKSHHNRQEIPQLNCPTEPRNHKFFNANFSIFPDINNLANTTITKVPAVRAVTAKAVESLPHGLGLKHDDYPPPYGNSAILDTYMQYFGENLFGKLLFLNHIIV